MKASTKTHHLVPIMFAFLALLLVAALPAVAAASASNLVSQLVVTPRTPNVLHNSTQQVAIDFNYTTTESGGVYIWARPMSGGVPTPNYSASGSTLHPVGSGTASQFFTITSGNATVDQIRFEMWDSSQTTLLYQAFIPVHYKFTSAMSNVLSRIGLTATPNVLKFGQKVSVSFDYATNRAAGVRIFARPLTSGSPTPNYAANASPLYAVGTHTGHGWFTVRRGAVTVTGVRLTMWNASQTRLLYKVVLPVNYQYRGATNIVNSIKLSPRSANLLLFGEQVSLTANYKTNQAGGVKIFARPMTAGALTPSYGAHGSPTYPFGVGPATGWFTISSGATTVDQIRIQMLNADQTKLLFQAKLPVSYQYN